MNLKIKQPHKQIWDILNINWECLEVMDSLIEQGVKVDAIITWFIFGF